MIIDSAGPPDNALSFLINDIYLKYETAMERIIKFIRTGKMSGLVVKQHGYRRTDREIIDAARQYGLVLEKKNCYGFLTEFKRSIVLGKLLSRYSIMEKVLIPIGRLIPHVRMFDFRKVAQNI